VKTVPLCRASIRRKWYKVNFIKLSPQFQYLSIRFAANRGLVQRNGFRIIPILVFYAESDSVNNSYRRISPSIAYFATSKVLFKYGTKLVTEVFYVAIGCLIYQWFFQCTYLIVAQFLVRYYSFLLFTAYYTYPHVQI